jgi:hypothetical protein
MTAVAPLQQFDCREPESAFGQNTMGSPIRSTSPLFQPALKH